MISSIEANGYFVGTFFGIKDSWVKSRNKMKFYKIEEVKKLFKQFDIIELTEISICINCK